MSTNYVENISRFSNDVDETAVSQIEKNLGIALTKKDSSLVATADSSELDRIRDGFCHKHLDLGPEEATTLINEVVEQMKDDKFKCRVTFYYLLAEKAGKINKFAS